ncbi:adenine phosphoribosyltransferase [Maribacter sp. SA7]|uniref:adenine phosphoribosyltransferase n=1 Tax=Maribacter zhoushanensis TaxID=3030012 RepID=UPI0023EB9A10|nr:adenine phosphoribosyltransferase [Maribacter zhoushanensis]MDF4202332.1 adenine phosphoribosyltransferase [Maribacter zhoushanensis]
MDFKSLIRDVPDFPKEGVVFKDITLLLQNPKALHETANALHDLLNGQQIDKVVGMESRGFIFGPMLAQKLNAGFVPVRKPGKLPSTTLSETYDLEYGTDTLEIHIDGIEKGDKVLIHDDVLATGGTAKATCNLIEKLGGEIVQCNFLIELTFLEGVSKISDYAVKSLVKY